ncbi:MAG TPA: hypothetical protein VFH73_23245 [Polyangia bacterium]|nr:hypothetical protein [Polyangia bacterium]
MPDDPRRTRLDEIGRQKAALDAEAIKLIRELQDDMMKSAGIPKADRERHLNMSDAERAALTGETTGRIVSVMNVDDTGQTSAVKRAIARGRRNHPAQVILYEAGVTITDVATELKETRQRVSAWMSDRPKDLRGIPRRHVEYLKRKYKIPASAWARIED